MSETDGCDQVYTGGGPEGKVASIKSEGGGRGQGGGLLG